MSKAVCVLMLFLLPALAYNAVAQPRDYYLVFFEYSQSNLTPEARKVIKLVADTVKSTPGSRVEVIGHTDTAEDAAISLERARNVAAELVTLGVPSDRIIYVTGAGDSKPLVPTAKDVLEPQNRRVQVNIIQR